MVCLSRRSKLAATSLLAVVFISNAACAQAQLISAHPAAKLESVEDLKAHLSVEQGRTFDQATNNFNEQRYADALPLYKQLLAQLPGDPVISKFVAEAALNTGDVNSASIALKPLAEATPNDWQATALLTRACAQSGDKACRDSGMVHMLDLHRQGVTPRNMQAYLLEEIKTGDRTLVIRTSLEPWGHYKVYDLGQVLDKDRKLSLRITLESGDSDQPLFAQQHPKEAAQGLRQFSMDGYRETGLNGDGTHTQEHFTYKFFIGQPSYDTVREEFIKIANGPGAAISSRTGVTVQ